jgi:hypothetical protein
MPSPKLENECQEIQSGSRAAVSLERIYTQALKSHLATDGQISEEEEEEEEVESVKSPVANNGSNVGEVIPTNSDILEAILSMDAGSVSLSPQNVPIKVVEHTNQLTSQQTFESSTGGDSNSMSPKTTLDESLKSVSQTLENTDKKNQGNDGLNDAERELLLPIRGQTAEDIFATLDARVTALGKDYPFMDALSSLGKRDRNVIPIMYDNLVSQIKRSDEMDANKLPVFSERIPKQRIAILILVDQFYQVFKGNVYRWFSDQKSLVEEHMRI